VNSLKIDGAPITVDREARNRGARAEVEVVERRVALEAKHLDARLVVRIGDGVVNRLVAGPDRRFNRRSGREYAADVGVGEILHRQILVARRRRQRQQRC
jgi:hypothetical protein